MKFKTNAFIRLMLLMLIILSQKTMAQDGKFALTIGGGMSLPIGDFASADTNNSDAGFAKLGFYTSLNTDFFVTENFGICAAFNYMSNGYDDETIGYYSESFARSAVGSGVNLRLSQSSSSPYKNMTFLGGVTARVGLDKDKKATFGVRALGGLVSSTTPYISLSIDIQDAGILSLYYSDESVSAFAYEINPYFGFKLSDKLSLNVNASYFAVDLSNVRVRETVSFYATNPSLTSDISTENTILDFPISCIKLGIGLSYNF